jgi:hypothetical protein
MHFFAGQDPTTSTYKNRQVYKQRVHTIQSTPNYLEGLGEDGDMWDLEGLAHRMTLGQVLDAWSEEQQGDDDEEETATETEKSGGDTGGEGRSGATVSFEGAGDGGDGGSSSSSFSDSSEDETREDKESDKARRKRKKKRRESTQVEIQLMAQNHKAQLAMNEAKEKAKQLQEDNNQIKRDRACALPLIDGVVPCVVHLAHKSLRLFLAAASLGGYTAAEKVSQVRLQTGKLDKKEAKMATWCEATDQMALVEKMLVGNMRMCPLTMAKGLVEGTVAHSEEIWTMFTTEWNGSFPEETDAETRESEILLLQKATIDPHFVPWLTGKDQYNKYTKNGWRMRELGEYVSMTALQRKTMAASLPRGMREYPKLGGMRGRSRMARSCHLMSLGSTIWTNTSHMIRSTRRRTTPQK